MSLLTRIGEFSPKENNMNQHNIRKWKVNVSPPGFRRGGSARNIALWHYLFAETGWLKLIPNGIFPPPPPNPCESEVFQDIRVVCMDLGTPPKPGGESFLSLIINKLQMSPQTWGCSHNMKSWLQPIYLTHPRPLSASKEG